ncbi:mitogen-activated protein kinase kinase kinase [Pleurotus ostreatus]|nr:mitogen-activated protein kinase kinase kinase [Pleurotus ostreatus]
MLTARLAMSESDGRKRIRHLFIANPDVENDDDIPPVQFKPQPQTYPYVSPVTSPYPPARPTPTVDTNLPSDSISRAPAHPGLSSPSSTSSPAAESTPPRTPGNLGSSGDFDNHGPDRDFAARKQFKPPAVRPLRNVNSPTVVGSDSSTNSTITVAEKVIIVVTPDAERYYTVDISGAKDPAFIKERIFTKLSIWEEEDQKQFSIWVTEIGAYALGDALSDERLFELCRERGDSKGSLKLLVSYSSALVHEPVAQLHPPISYSPNPIPPPVLPPNFTDTAPLRPKRRSRSRQGSLSSTSDPRNGYEADLDNPDWDSHRATMRPPPHQPFAPQSTPNPPSPLTRRSNGTNSNRAVSPLPRPPSPPQDRRRPSTADVSPTYGEHSTYGPPVPPPQSPSRPSFTDEHTLAVPPKRLHGRSGSDAAAEREQAIQASEDHKQNTSRWHHQLHSSKSRPDLQYNKRLPLENDDWVHVDPTRDITRSSPSIPFSGPQLSPVRAKIPSTFANRSVSGIKIPTPPRLPPPAVPPTSNFEPRYPPQGRSVGRNAANPQWPAPFKEEMGGQKAMITSGPHWKRMLKVARSVDNLKASGHPPSMRPGLGRRPDPASRLGSVGSSSNPPPLPKHHRPLPVQASPHSNSIDFSHYSNFTPPLPSAGLSASSTEPYPRPQSAIGEHPNSPSLRFQVRMQSPTYTNSHDPIPQDILRSPRAISPIRSYPSAGGYGSKPSTNLVERSSDRHHGSDVHRTPPRSPTSPMSPRRPPTRERRPDVSASESSTLIPDEDNRATLTVDAQRVFAQYMKNNNSEATLLVRPRNDADVPTSPLPPKTPSDVSKLSPPLLQSHLPSDESDSDRDDCGTSLSMWAKPPMVDNPSKSARGPALKVQIQNDNGSTSPVSVPSTASDMSSAIRSSAPKMTPLSSRSPSPRHAGRGSTFIDMRDYTWAPRPPPEDVYDRLEDFFPEHDLDKPVIEASSGGTSPTAPEYPPVPPLQINDRGRVRSKKSIRIVAEEHKKRASRAAAASHTTMSRKRSTKLWGSRVEEVTTLHAAKASLGANLPDSPPGGPNSATFKWVRGELIGKGTYGQVYLALNATTGEMMAVKQVEIPQTLSDRNDTRQVTVVEALKFESETLKDLDHPNIVQYLGFEETPSNLSIFLEYVPGGSIGSCLLKHGKFDEEVTKSFTGQILDGLEYLHSKGILHRDLKADNILVEKSGVCKISDFGISKRTDDMGGAMTAMKGTVFWMAPEVINSQKKGYNFKIDIWSMGCVVLEMWAGMRPWNGDEVVAVMFKLYQAKLPPPVPDDVILSPLADDFRRKCFAINPEERPTASELRRHKYLTLPDNWVFTGFT